MLLTANKIYFLACCCCGFILVAWVCTEYQCILDTQEYILINLIKIKSYAMERNEPDQIIIWMNILLLTPLAPLFCASTVNAFKNAQFNTNTIGPPEK